MSTGVFHIPHPHGGGRVRIWTPRNVAKLCDVIADGGTFEEAAAACKVSAMQAKMRFGRVIAEMGAQAA